MRQLAICVGFAAVLAAVVAAQDGSSANVSVRRAAADASTELSFEPNHGQFDAEVRFASRGRGYTLFITDREAVVALRSSAVRLALTGARALAPIGLEQQPGIVNYLIGNDPAKWRTHIPTFSRVQYDDVYPGIDLVYYGRGSTHEYDLVVAPGADPSRIAMQVTGADAMALDGDGHLRLATADGAVSMRAPHVYQTIDGERRAIDARYVVAGDGAVSFALGEYQRDAALVIDPELVYGTFLGGSGDRGDLPTQAVALDGRGAPYIVGSTETTDFPTQAPIQSERRGFSDAVITKLTPDGLQRVYATYLGGSGFDGGSAIDVRADGVAYVAGGTTSEDFPVRDAFQSQRRGTDDAFVVELAANGASILKGTFLGGGGGDGASGLQLARRADPAPPVENQPPPLANAFADLVFVYGATTSPDFPTVQPAQATRAGDRDAFVTAFDRQTLRPVYSTYVGRAGTSTPDSLVLNRVKGDFYFLLQRGDDEVGPLLAHFRARPPAATGRVQPQVDAGLGWDLALQALVAGLGVRAQEEAAARQQAKAARAQACKLETPAQLQQLFLTPQYVELVRANCRAVNSPGGRQSASDVIGAAVAGDVLDRTAFLVILTGCFPVAPATTCSQRAVLVLYDDEMRVIEHVNFGGTRVGREFIPTRIVAGDSGDLHVIGRTSDATLPVVNPVQGNNAGGAEGFVLTLNLESGVTSFFSYLGGRSGDGLSDIAVDRDGNRWIVGDTQSADFPVTRSGVQPEIRGRTDGFVVKITP